MVRPSNSVGKHANHCQSAVGEFLDVVDRVEQLADAAVTERLTLQRNQYALRSGEGQGGQDAQRGRAVDDDEVVAAEQRLQEIFKSRSRP